MLKIINIFIIILYLIIDLWSLLGISSLFDKGYEYYGASLGLLLLWMVFGVPSIFLGILIFYINKLYQFKSSKQLIILFNINLIINTFIPTMAVILARKATGSLFAGLFVGLGLIIYIISKKLYTK